MHRLFPTTGPGGVVGAALSHAVGVNVSNTVHVTRQLDVVEVLERDDDFSVRIYDEKMTETTGPFYLGMNELDRYTADARVIQPVVRRSDAELVRRIAAEETAHALAGVRRTGIVDVVTDLLDVVPIRVVLRYYGLEGEDPEPFVRLFQVSAKYLFVFWSTATAKRDAIEAGREIRQILERVVARRRRNGEFGDDDLLGRLLSSTNEFSDGDAGIVRSIAGLASGNMNAPIGLFVLSVDKLLSLAEPQIERVRKLAREGAAGSASARESFGAHFNEAERFGVYPPFTYRHAERDTTLAKGTTREKVIPKGCIVVAWHSIAAFDADVFDEPFRFSPGRPKWQYLGFGHGRHRCVGEQIGQIMLEEIARALFALPRLRRAPGSAGTPQFLPIQSGGFAKSFGLVFDKVT